jgi:hypothetical protein
MAKKTARKTASTTARTARKMPRKTPHLLRVAASADRFAPLIAAARALDLRIGWLDLAAATSPLPESLAGAAALDVLRAVAVGEGRTVAVKPLRGAPVLRDLLREHFRGCALVLVRGEADAPALEPEGDSWRLAPAGAAARLLTTEQLAAALRKPHPWEAGAPPP